MEEDLDARVFGNLLHNIIFWFYEDLQAKKKGRIDKADLVNPNMRIDELIDRAFREHYHLDPARKVEYAGQRVVVQEIVRDFVSRILEIDEDYAPFIIERLEAKMGVIIKLRDDLEVKVSGKIDRADRKDGTVRIIDYKTGSDELNIDSVESLFNGEGPRNKAAFQTFLYAWLYENEGNKAMQLTTETYALTPGLMNRKNLFAKEFTFGHQMGRGKLISDVRTHFPDFEGRLKDLLGELYNPEVPFDQTPNVKNCEFCPYKNICYRN